MSYSDSMKLRDEYLRRDAEARELERQQAILDQSAAARAANAAAATIHYDADHEWTSVDPNKLTDWVDGAIC